MKKNDISIPQNNFPDQISKWSSALHHLKKFCEIVDPDESDSVYKNFIQAILQKKFMNTLGSKYNYFGYSNDTNSSGPHEQMSRSKNFHNTYYSNSNQFTFSRFESEFVVIKNVFENSNSSVYQAINKLDGCIYAVKKIQQPIVGSDLELIIQEARIMPNLIHPNLIRYNTSWVEFKIKGEPDNAIVVESKSSIDSLIKNFGSQPKKKFYALEGKMQLSLTFDGKNNDNDNNDNDNNDNDNNDSSCENNYDEEHENDNDNDNNETKEENETEHSENDEEECKGEDEVDDTENKDEKNIENENANDNENSENENFNDVNEDDEEAENKADNDNDDKFDYETNEKSDSYNFDTYGNRKSDFAYESSDLSEHTYTETCTDTENHVLVSFKDKQPKSNYFIEDPTDTKTLDDTDYSEYDDDDNTKSPIDFVFYLQMELCLDTSFYDFMKQLDLRSRLEKFLHVCYGLQYLHRAGIVHRDLKPSNILIGNDEEPKLADFGISIYTSHPYVHAMEFMTAVYASPEHNDPDKISTKSDIFSLGLIFIQILGDYKTKMEEMLSMSNLKKFGNLPKYFTNEKEFPQKITNLIVRMAKPNPDERPDIDEVINVIKETLDSFG